MQYSMFCVGERPFCVWNSDIQERNIRFLQSVDGQYFEYVAQVNGEHLEGEQQQWAAIALRIAYYHGLETLFALLCASLQAPDCVYAWIQKYQPGQLRAIVRTINAEKNSIVHKYCEKQVSWDILSKRIHAYSNKDPERVQDTISLFAQLWKRLAADYVEEVHTSEYNSIKHGFRTRLGGFGMAFGIEEEYGVPAPEENTQMMTYSKFGTSFFAQEPIINSPREGDWHFTTKYHALNWNPEAIGYALYLISMSINNILSYLKIVNGMKPEDVKFTRPQESEIFDKPWQNSSLGITNVRFGGKVEETQITPFSKKEILKCLEKAGG